jgi:hypothetical protein
VKAHNCFKQSGDAMKGSAADRVKALGLGH